ncbi:hypothetical protein BMR07_18600 [Methylococcaceae bacterium CS1]|uniref:hypothetical protein n=1 Tax=Bathymodiolus platifrons methanotrophic gill symbiont TaxID=113268 RepID=UPI000B41E97D|nr:hypothetical protein [Bathymodiolus platifrons methanotrophic gill symbiont]TXK93474.1 hypothetical protein BMR11_16860 [Methylococcaceae bacterium CS5]TXK96607.1 hypothetical protein BMR10_07165 [Methylococcaceae bacterium CS4]TXL01672.1 hypothetical protein BMR07_18600 [Methylococcaceae bacterium CS1]TXL07266.1 hypothetical protein BMR09_06230 [Methylococcaceae bacterium CS3]TXL10831.1 hypothetical protein BMR08_06830 [Methylococcaceae bacterium CS2]
MHIRLLLFFAYSLKTSTRYQKTKTFFYALLENPQSKLKSCFDVFMIILVISSVFSLIYEVQNEVGDWAIYFERFVVFIFICEYLLRGWLYSDTHNLIIKQYENSEYLDTPFRLYKVFTVIISS